MSVFIIHEANGGYHQLRDSPHYVVYLRCKRCNDETPQSLDPYNGGYVAVCGACSNIEKFCNFVLHDKCKAYVEAVGFISTPKTKLLVVKSQHDLGKYEGKQIPVVVWCPDPIDHKEICGQPLDLSKGQ